MAQIPTAMAGERDGTSDHGLAELIRAGDVSTMEQVFTANLTAIYNYCYRRTGSWQAAEDLTASVFCEAWRSRRRAVVVDGTLLPWLYGVAANVCRHHQRSTARRSRLIRRLATLRPPRSLGTVSADDATDHPADAMVDALVARDWLHRALADLPAGDQDAFILVCWQGLGYAQAAAALSIPIGTVRSRVHRVRQRLQQAYRSTDPDLSEEHDHE